MPDGSPIDWENVTVADLTRMILRYGIIESFNDGVRAAWRVARQAEGRGAMEAAANIERLMRDPRTAFPGHRVPDYPGYEG